MDAIFLMRTKSNSLRLVRRLLMISALGASVSICVRGADLTIQSKTYVNGQTATEEATDSIITSGSVVASSGSNVTYIADNGSIHLKSGFKASNGSVFTATIPWDADTDHDGMPNWWELAHSLDPNNAADASQDSDSDGVVNSLEYVQGLDPQVKDAIAFPSGWPNAKTTNTHLVGFTAGSYSVDQSGAMTYSIPIWTTPGTNGMQPAISLNYNHDSGNGYLGVGWSIGGLSVISRRAATKATDGTFRAVQLDSNDRYALDGNRLITVSGTNGANGTEYRTERESFSRIYSYGSSSYGPDRFVVITKAGLTMEYGSSAATDGGRITAQSPAPSAAVVCWALDKITDAAGNYCEFHYTKYSSGEFLLASIKYTGNSAAGLVPYAELVFTYVSRTDKMAGYIGGAPWARTQRLDNIQSKYGGIMVRKYTLSYETSPNTGRSRLTTITESDADGKNLPSIALHYKNETNGWVDTPAYGPPEFLTHIYADGGSGASGAGFVDIDGDGLPDFIHRHYEEDGFTNTNLVDRNTGSLWTENFPNATGFQSPRFLGMAASYTDIGMRFVDLNGDGYLDMICSRDHDVAGESRQAVFLNSATGWTSSSQWSPTSFVIGGHGSNGGERNLGVRFVDLDGDGRVDVIWARHDTTERGALRNNGSGWESFPAGTTFTPPSGIRFGDEGYPEGPAKIVDLNGDGLPDIVQYPEGGTSKAYLNTGSGWAESSAYAPRDPTIAGWGDSSATDFIDVNGDGLVDQVTSRDSNSAYGDPSYVATWLNTGTGWIASPSYSLPKYIAGSKRYGVAFADVNGDGLVDMICSMYVDGQGQKYTYLNTGSGWALSSEYTSPVYFVYGQAVLYGVLGAQVIDIDGNGLPDVVERSWLPGGAVNFVKVPDQTDNTPHAYLNKSGRPDLLDTITASSGLKTQVTYDFLTHAGTGVYTRGSRPSASSFPVVDVQDPTYVVRTVTQDDGLGGSYVLTYSYGELRRDALEGSLGFGWIKCKDGRTNVTTETDYNQDYPKIGLVASVTATQSNGKKLSEQTTTWATQLNSANSRIAFVYPQTVVEKSYEIGATTPFLTKTTTTTCNATWGDVTEVKVSYDDGYETDEKHTLTYASSPTYPGQLSDQTITVKASSLSPNPVESKTRTRKLTYDSKGRVQDDTVEPGDAGTPKQYYLKTSYARDSYGNVKQVAVTAPDALTAVSRTTDLVYSSTFAGRFLTKRSLTIGSNHIATTYDHYDESLGALLQKTEMPFAGSGTGLVTTYQVDSLGRVTLEDGPDGSTAVSRFWSSSGPSQTSYAVQTFPHGFAPKLEFFDGLGRSRRVVTLNGDRSIAVTDRTYDNRGQVASDIRPHLQGAAAVYGTTTTYDVLGRVFSRTTPDGTFTYDYDGFVTTIDAPDASYQSATGVTYTRTVNYTETTRTSQGWVTKVVQSGKANGTTATSQIAYTCDPFGSLKTTTDSAGNVITITPDLYGRKTKIVDPDRGTWSYKYYPTGELGQQTDARNIVTSLEYDALGRLSQRTVDVNGTSPQVSSWTYDSATGFGRGALKQATSPGYSESRTYDDNGHVNRVSRTFGGSTYVVGYTYDTYGRLKTTAFNSGASTPGPTIRRDYSDFGTLAELRNDATNALYFQATEYAPDGQLEHATYGDGIQTDRTYRPEDGLVDSIQSGRSTNPDELQNLVYSYEPGTSGNLYKRQDLRQSLAERFVYDGLVRLTQVWKGAADGSAGTRTLLMAYDAIGNITSRAGNSYAYDPTRVHAVQTAFGNTYAYDANGNMKTVAGAQPASMTWTAFNLPDTLTQGSTSSAFAYDADQHRTLQTRGDGSKLAYIGDDWERDVSGSTTTDSFYLFTPLGRTVELVYVNGAAGATRYYLTDHLGSVDTVVTGSSIATPERLSYDAWGVRRLSDWTAGAVATTVRRGFTDHEMLDGLGLVHMNGRIYNPALGRFLSADPINQDIYNTQTYNAYSYVLNNPLSHTDPTGMQTADMAASAQMLFPGFMPWLMHLLEPAPSSGAGPNTSSIPGSLANNALLNNSFNPNTAVHNGVWGWVERMNTIMGDMMGIDPDQDKAIAQSVAGYRAKGFSNFQAVNFTVNPTRGLVLSGIESFGGTGMQSYNFGDALSFSDRLDAGYTFGQNAVAIGTSFTSLAPLGEGATGGKWTWGVGTIREEAAQAAYASIRESTTDVAAISRYTGYKPERIASIKDYLFKNKEWTHADADIATAWHRLRTGAGTSTDLLLLKHETAEMWYRANVSPAYSPAHQAANQKWNWQRAVERY